MSSPAALRAAKEIVKWYSTMSLGYPERASAVAAIIDAEFAAERAELERQCQAYQSAFAGSRMDVAALKAERAELIEALRSVIPVAGDCDPSAEDVAKARAVLVKVQ